MKARNSFRSIFFGFVLTAAAIVIGNNAATAQTAVPAPAEQTSILFAETVRPAAMPAPGARGLQSVEKEAAGNTETRVRSSAALAAQGLRHAQYLYLVTTAPVEPADVNTTVREIPRDGGVILLVGQSGGSGTCAGSTLPE